MLYWDGEPVYEVSSFEAKIKIDREDLSFAGKMGKDSKMTGYSGEWSMKIKKVFSRGQAKLAKAIREGNDVRSQFVGKLNDPDAYGSERLVLQDCWFSELSLMNFENDVIEGISLNGWHFSSIFKDIIKKTTGFELIEEKQTFENMKSTAIQITGIVFLTGEKSIVVTISMSEKTAAILTSYMAGMQLSDVRLEDLIDGITEITNMVAGQIKAKLAAGGSHYAYLQPFSIIGNNHCIIQKSKVGRISRLFRSAEIEILTTLYIQ
jgi:CheY-specific phosphatase CheX